MKLPVGVAFVMVLAGLATALAGCVLLFGPVALVVGGALVAGAGLFGVDVTGGRGRS